MSQSPLDADRSTDAHRTPPHHLKGQSDAHDCYVSEWEAALIRFCLSCSLLAGLVVLGFAHNSTLELAMLATAVGATIIMVHKGQIEDPTA